LTSKGSGFAKAKMAFWAFLLGVFKKLGVDDDRRQKASDPKI